MNEIQFTGNHARIYVTELPKCDFCNSPAHYDARTSKGPWAYMCLQCFGVYGIKLGLGFGQELALKLEKDE